MKRLLIIVAGLALVVVLTIWAAIGMNAPADPVYEGTKLSEWVKECGSTNADKAVQARFAIGRIGSNAAPYLIYRLKHEAMKTFYLRKADRLFHTGTKFEQMNAGKILAIHRGILGLKPSALPDLERVMEESSNDEVLYQAFSVGEMMVMVSSDSRFRMHLSSNAVVKVGAALTTHGRGATSVQLVAVTVGPASQPGK